MSALTAFQQTAMAFPCRLGEETAHPRFARLVDGGSLVLSINFGYE